MRSFFTFIGTAVLASASFAQFTEGAGAHSTKATAQTFALSSGQFIDGSISAANEVDVYKVDLASQTAGIYRNQLTTSRRAGATATATTTLRGLTTTGTTVNAGTDTSVQASSAVGANADSLQQFYSFGSPTSVYLRATGTTARAYKTTYTQTLITPTAITGTFNPGAYTFDANGVDGTDTVDTEVVLYNSSFGIVGTNDDESSTELASLLNVNLAVGTYYLAISDWDLSHSNANAAGDGNQTGVRAMDFAGTLANSSSFQTGFNQATIDLAFQLTSPSGSQQLNGIKTERFGVNWYSFTVAEPVPEPATMLALGLGAAGLLRRRRSSK